MSDTPETTVPYFESEPTPAEKAKRQRIVWPIRICRADTTARTLKVLDGAPTFAEAREAYDWISANAIAGETLIPARFPDTAKRFAVDDVPFP